MRLITVIDIHVGIPQTEIYVIKGPFTNTV